MSWLESAFRFWWGADVRTSLGPCSLFFRRPVVVVPNLRMKVLTDIVLC